MYQSLSPRKLQEIKDYADSRNHSNDFPKIKSRYNQSAYGNNAFLRTKNTTELKDSKRVELPKIEFRR